MLPQQKMKLKGLPRQLVGFLSKDHVWHAKGTLTADMVWKHDIGKHYGKRYLPETVGRALRSLEEQSIIAVKAQGISVAYKWLPPSYRKTYIPVTQRKPGKEHVLFREAIPATDANGPTAYKD